MVIQLYIYDIWKNSPRFKSHRFWGLREAVFSSGWILTLLSRPFQRQRAGEPRIFSIERIYIELRCSGLSCRSGIAQKKAGKLRGKFNFDLAAKNPQKFRMAFFSYNPDEKGKLKMNMGYKTLSAKVKGKKPFYICILIDLLQIKEGVDQRIENWRDESA